MKNSGPTTEYEEIDRFDGGVGWISYPDETMRRASHALVGDGGGGVWLVDPVDAEGVDDLVSEYGEVAGVVVLLDRHKRDAAQIARRHGVSVWVPQFMDGVVEKLDATVERFRYDLADTGYTAHPLVENRFWQEAILYNEERGVLVVPEAVGTSSYFLSGGERLGVHPLLRLTPPQQLRRLDVERVLVGHGEGIHNGANAELDRAIEGSRRRAPKLMIETVKNAVFG